MTMQLKLPNSLLDNECTVKMLTFLFPCTIDKSIENFPPQMTDNLREVFVTIFKESSIPLRNSFFSDKLVKYLWS